MIILKSDRLAVTMLEPGEGTNSLERFDRSAYIEQVTLDGKYDFCSGEPGELLPHRLTGGKGLVSEIKCDLLGEEAGKNAWFPKFGVGLLYNESGEKFTFRDPYKMDPFEVKWTATDSEARFNVLPRECMGYALDEKRVVKVEDNTITISYEFTNVGQKALELGEYVHNFLTIEHKPLGPAYHLTAAIKPIDGAVSRNGVAYGKGSGIEWKGYSDSSCMMQLKGDVIDDSVPFFWKLTNDESPCWVQEETSFTPSHAPVWSIDHIVSCECYHTFTVAPGETVKYWRKWTFGG